MFLSNIWNKGMRRHIRGAERRISIRLTSHHLVKYKVLDKREELSFVKNISKGGVLFHSKEDLAPGSMVELMINYPGYSQPIKATAKVLRARPLKKVGGFDIAAEFVSINEDAREFIREKIESVSAKKKKKKK
ncbi:MAG: PilZ domain-containing protein [Candidatus Omnitrophota bacterium]